MGASQRSSPLPHLQPHQPTRIQTASIAGQLHLSLQMDAEGAEGFSCALLDVPCGLWRSHHSQQEHPSHLGKERKI